MVSIKKLLVYIAVPLVALAIVVGIALGIIFSRNNSEAISSESRQKLVIDHDGGADDAFAITLSLLNEKYFGGPNLVALTTVHGNVNLSQVIINSDRILTLCNRKDIPIHSGSTKALISGIESDYYYGFDGLGDNGYVPPGPIAVQPEPSAIALLELSKKYEGELIVIAIGPLTNVALAARLDSEFIGRLAQLYVGGGHIYSDQYPKPEFNADMDPEAYYIVADSAIADKVTFVAFSQVHTTMRLPIDWRHNVFGAIPTPIVKALNSFERVSSAQHDTYWEELDPAVAAIALNNSIVEEFRNTNNSIMLCGDQRALNTNEFESSNPNSRVVYAGNANSYKRFLFDVFSADLTS